MAPATRVAAAILVGGALTSASAAQVGVRIAEFDVRLKGVQTTSWEKHHIAEGECDVPIDGSGSETYRFRTSKPLRVRAIRTGAGVFLTARDRTAKLRLTGALRRVGRMEVGEGAPCAEGDGTGYPTPNPPDCGTKKARTTVEIGFLSSRRPDWLVLSEGDGYDPFDNCPTGSPDQFPQLMAWDGQDRRIGQSLPAEDLFRYGKSIVIARGSKTQRVPEASAQTDITWTASFTRVRDQRKATR